MKNRLMAFCFALISACAVSTASAQDCAPCAAAGPDVSCASCCASCTGVSCELFGGLRSLLACRPCAVVECAPSCAAAPAPVCGPIVSTNLPTCDVPEATCGPAPICAPAPVCGPMFPYLKPCLYNAVHRPVNGVCKIVHGVFDTLATITTPTSDAGFFKPAYVCGVPCACGAGELGSCATCGDIETAPAPAPCMPAVPSCN